MKDKSDDIRSSYEVYLFIITSTITTQSTYTYLLVLIEDSSLTFLVKFLIKKSISIRSQDALSNKIELIIKLVMY